MVLLHIIIALTSIAFATYLLLAPSATKFYAHFGLIGLTVASGTFLLVRSPAHMLETCTSGLIYTGFVSILTLFARRRLAAQRIRITKD